MPTSERISGELVLKCANLHGEGILWNPADNRLWWTDIHGKALWWHEPGSGRSGSLPMPKRLCAFALRERTGWIMAFDDSIELRSHDFHLERRLDRAGDIAPGTRLNDGRTDRFGNFVVGGMSENGAAARSAVFHVQPNGMLRILIDDVLCANSICFAPDGRQMYFTDTSENRIRRYRYAEDGIGPVAILHDGRAAAGLPDGSCVDAEGGVWNARWDGGEVIRIAPDGRVTHRIVLPVARPTCCAFGGDDMATLFVTTSRLELDSGALERFPLSGALFCARPGMRGLQDRPFAG